MVEHKSKQIVVWLNPELWLQARRYALKHKVSLAAVIRAALSEYLKEHLSSDDRPYSLEQARLRVPPKKK